MYTSFGPVTGGDAAPAAAAAAPAAAAPVAAAAAAPAKVERFSDPSKVTPYALSRTLSLTRLTPTLINAEA